MKKTHRETQSLRAGCSN